MYEIFVNIGYLRFQRKHQIGFGLCSKAQSAQKLNYVWRWGKPRPTFAFPWRSSPRSTLTRYWSHSGYISDESWRFGAVYAGLKFWQTGVWQKRRADHENA